MGARTTGRVVMPKDAKGKLDLSKKLFAKHQADGAASELKSLVDYDWNIVGPTVAAAQTAHDQAVALKAQAEAKFLERDAKLAPIVEITRASAKYLKGKFSKNAKKLADWGFTIDDTPPKPRKKKNP